MPSIQLQGKIFLQGDIHAKTGLHIGGNTGDLDIGGVDTPVIRNQLNRHPYIPGSSLRGKMRSLLDRHFQNDLNKPIGSGVRVHECKSPRDYKVCPVCQVFGVAPQGAMRGETLPTRLIVRDTFLDPESEKALDTADMDTDYTEIKTEVAIDRITSAATPRHQERVPAGVIFGPLKIVHSLYTQNGTDTATQLQAELRFFQIILIAMELLEDDYLGGSGSRGYGQIAFKNMKMLFKSRKYYEDPAKHPITTLAENIPMSDLRKVDYLADVLAEIETE